MLGRSSQHGDKPQDPGFRGHGVGLPIVGDGHSHDGSGVCRDCGSPRVPGFQMCAECREKVNLENRLKRAEEVARRQPKACARCGVDIGVDYKPSGGRPRKFCSDACCYESRRSLKPAKACSVCGAETPSARQSICSDECRRRLARSKARIYDAAKKPLIQRVCRGCATKFVPAFGDARRVWCSKRCQRKVERRGRAKNHEQRARRKGSPVDYSITSLKVFERDRWTCQLCKRRTPKALKGTVDPRAPELDHIIPIAAGGGHTWDNVQCACRECNGNKGSKPLGQLRLSA
jgi:5-methylcytosine-specific restriction endonuclease McrA